MKYLLVFVALVGFASCADSDDLALCKQFLQCCHKAIDGGVPSIPIPNHNPLTIQNIALNGSNLVVDYSLSVTENILYNLTDYNITHLTAESYTNPGRVNFDYNIYWPQLNFTGNFEVNISTFLLDEHFKGTYNIVMREVNWSGIFNLTKPGQQGVKEHLDDFTLNSKTESVDVTITGLNSAVAFTVEESLQLGLYTLMNNFPAQAADFLREERFNGFWIAHPEKIDQVIAFCNQ